MDDQNEKTTDKTSIAYAEKLLAARAYRRGKWSRETIDAMGYDLNEIEQIADEGTSIFIPREPQNELDTSVKMGK